MKAYKKLTKSGAVTFPRAIRQEAGIHPGTALNVVTDEGGIHITKHVPVCFHCGTADDVLWVFGIEICRECAQRIKAAFHCAGGGRQTQVEWEENQ